MYPTFLSHKQDWRHDLSVPLQPLYRRYSQHWESGTRKYPTASVCSETIPCLLGIINRRHCGQLCQALLLEGNSSRWQLTGRSVSSPEKDTSLLSFSNVIFWSFEYHQQVSSRIHCTGVTADASAAAIFKPNETLLHHSSSCLWWTSRLINCDVNYW